MIDSDSGQIYGIKFEDREFMHPGAVESVPGWPNSELVAFPFFGPADKHQVVWNNEVYPLDQHGISRVLPWEIIFNADKGVTLKQGYDGSEVPNPKSGKNHPKSMKWMPFELEKRLMMDCYALNLYFNIKNTGDEIMPFNLGWHPAFRTEGEGDLGKLYVEGSEDPIASVRDVLQGGPIIIDTSRILYRGDSQGIDFRMDGFEAAVLWTPHEGMICIEPVLKRPVVNGAYFSEGEFDTVAPNQTRRYKLSIRPFVF